MRVWDLADLSLKFERHTDAETVKFQLLDSSWHKSVLLQSDRSVEFHGQGGVHYKTRVPKFGRDLTYHPPTCHLSIATSSPSVFRLDLHRGTFLAPIETSLESVNAISTSDVHGLMGMAGDGLRAEFWDTRAARRVASLDVLPHIASFLPLPLTTSLLPPTSPAYTPPTSPSLTALSFSPDGLHVALGTSTGQVALYDLRRPVPVVVKDHGYGEA
ncbi:hypothetical protein HDU93_004368, partial [Gonapodya sp. JEL0774]